MNIPETIYNQIGGDQFAAITGSNNFCGDGNTLRMCLARNKSGANRLYITLDSDDTYTMRFFKYTSGRLKVDHKNHTCVFVDEKVKEIKTLERIYFDQLAEIFEETTQLYTRLF